MDKALKYGRSDFAQVGTTNRGCMRVVPGDRSKKALDKIAVGAQNGCVICLTRNSNDTQILFKTMPGAPIECMCMSGASGTLKDKIFVASETSVRGINKRARFFFSFDTNMAEVAKKNLVLTGKKSYNHYHDCADTNYLLSSEDVHDVVSLIAEGAWGDRPFTSVLACSDSTLKVIEGSKIGYEIRMQDVPYTLYLFMGDGGYSKHLVLYGTKSGKIGLASVPPGGGKVLWEMETTSTGAITAITCFTLTGSHFPDVIIGKEDGVVEIYTVDETDKCSLHGYFVSASRDENDVIRLKQCDETITSIACGYVSSPDEPEIVVCTHTGEFVSKICWIFSLSKITRNANDLAPQAANINVKIQQLKTEVEDLETKVTEERQRYDDMTKKQGANGVAFLPYFQVYDKFEFSPQLGVYNLTIELVIPIDFLLIQSKMPIRLVEVEKNASVVCEIRQSEMNPWPLLASYRCQANICRLELRVQVEEGEFGDLYVYICPKTFPKVVQVQIYQIKALSAHVRVHNFDMNRPANVLSFTGQFSISEAHSWLHQLLPDIPIKCPPTDTVTNNFQSATNGGTQLQVTYSRGSAVFRSDCMSTIAVIRERISEETLQKQIRTDVRCELDEDSVEHCLKLLDPKMSHLINLEKRRMYSAALKELEANNDDVSFLSEENAEMLRNHDVIFQQADADSLEDSGILSIYENLLRDRARLSGRSIRGKVEQLRTLLLEDYSLPKIVAFFKSSNEE
ncbi:unnamed protein product [Caenorhabditis auriculariae]|uniref:Bardet-Biedl syndrome 7 protein homolog n=1 Tax=Caenorhabditis auriculariae TaxID=2777116 RepID=A0A8S1GSK4_9PELO|nr:unnamed protein product [Caenorhabditis auriculariae]